MVTERDVVESCMCHRTRMATRALTRLYDDSLRSVGLRATQLAVLVGVGGDDVVSITALAKFMGMDRSTLTRNLAPLEREGLIRVGNEGWRRRAWLKLQTRDARDCARRYHSGRRPRKHCSESWASGNGLRYGPT
jgi:DNA-binding MarR family transcriptional regulator